MLMLKNTKEDEMNEKTQALGLKPPQSHPKKHHAMAPPMAKTPTRNQGRGLNRTRKLKNIDRDLIATLPWTMEFMASLAMAATKKAKCTIIYYTIGRRPTHKDVDKWFLRL
jgi:hypothetical protein